MMLTTQTIMLKNNVLRITDVQ